MANHPETYVLFTFMVIAGAGQELSEGLSVILWWLILALGGTTAGAVDPQLASFCMAWASSQQGGREIDREREPDRRKLYSFYDLASEVTQCHPHCILLNRIA